MVSPSLHPGFPTAVYLLGSNEIDAQSTRSRTQQEQLAGVLAVSTIVELVHLVSSRLLRRVSVDSADFEPFVQSRPVLLPVRERLSGRKSYSICRTHNHIEHGGKLRKEQYLVALLEQSIQKSVQQEHLSAGINKIIVDYQLVRLRVGRPVEEERMRRDLYVSSWI